MRWRVLGSDALGRFGTAVSLAGASAVASAKSISADPVTTGRADAVSMEPAAVFAMPWSTFTLAVRTTGVACVDFGFVTGVCARSHPIPASRIKSSVAKMVFNADLVAAVDLQHTQGNHFLQAGCETK